MPLKAIARLIQTMLYAQRFFPYYVYNILGGIEEDGTRFGLFPSRNNMLIRHHHFTGSGAVYSFDPVGSYEREACRAAGAAQSLVQPFLDNQVCMPFAVRPLLRSAHPILTRLTPVCIAYHRYISRINSQHPINHIRCTCHYQTFFQSSLIHSRARQNATSRCVLGLERRSDPSYCLIDAVHS